MLSELIKHQNPCVDATRWLDSLADQEEQKAWDDCKRGDWMLWLIGKQITNTPPWSEERKPLLACALECAETVKHLWGSKLEKIQSAIAVLRDWIVGKSSKEEAIAARKELRKVGRVADAADAAAYAAAGAAGAAAADAAADAAAAYAAAGAAYAAAYAADAAADDAYADARSRSLSQTADIVRRHFPTPPKINP